MADYFSPTVVQQTIPHDDITPLEIILLSYVFTGEVYGEGWYFFAEQSPADLLTISRRELEDGLAVSQHVASESNSLVAKLLEEHPESTELDVDLSGTTYDFILQDIVCRSTTIKYFSVVSSWTCSKMRPDGFGGMVIVITADEIKGKSTLDFLQDFLAEDEIEP